MTDDRSTPLRRPCGAQCEGNVVPLTTLDRHTGRAASAAPDDLEMTAWRTRIDIVRVSSIPGSVTDPSHPAGSRDAEWCTPLEGSGEGSSGDQSVPEHDSALNDRGIPARILSSYSVNKTSSPRPRRARKTRTDSFKRREWERDTEAKTRFHRVGRASYHERKAREAMLAGRRLTAAWHESRARGQIRRYEQVRDCGGTDLLIKCEGCGFEVKRIEARCGHYRLCATCRGARASLLRYRFRFARERAVRRAESLMRPWTPGGRWSEKFLTLTLPHSGDIQRDIKALPKAWEIFRKRLWDHFRLDRKVDETDMLRIAFVRVLEVTPGRNNDGHAHAHVYLLSPFLPKALVRHLWGAALCKLGYQVPKEPMHEVMQGVQERTRQQLREWLVTRRGDKGRLLSEINAPIVGIEECYGDVENELVKYLIKDIERDDDGEHRLIEPELFAGVYAGLEGVRTVVTSTGFWGSRKSLCKCERCGSQQTTRERVNRKADSEPSPNSTDGDHD